VDLAQLQLKGTGEDELPVAALFVDDPLHVAQQLRCALHFFENGLARLAWPEDGDDRVILDLGQQKDDAEG